MTTHKIGSPAWKKLIVQQDKPVEKPVLSTTEIRLANIERAVNLILKKLEENEQRKVEQEKQLELPNFKYPTL
jgi:hypothetical protein